MPPSSWFKAVLIAFCMQVITIAVVFFRCGWKRGLIAIPIGIVALVLGTVFGLLVNFTASEIAPAPLIASLLAAWWFPLALGIAQRPQ